MVSDFGKVLYKKLVIIIIIIIMINVCRSHQLEIVILYQYGLYPVYQELQSKLTVCQHATMAKCVYILIGPVKITHFKMM